MIGTFEPRGNISVIFTPIVRIFITIVSFFIPDRIVYSVSSLEDAMRPVVKTIKNYSSVLVFDETLVSSPITIIVVSVITLVYSGSEANRASASLLNAKHS